jgi:hypothetical protein
MALLATTSPHAELATYLEGVALEEEAAIMVAFGD